MAEDKFKKLKKIAALFPKTTASGHAFINREQERVEIENRVLLQNHTWIAAMRRIGKTSLLEQACLDVSRRKHAGKVVSFMTDMNLWPDLQALQQMLQSAASEILNTVESADARKYLALGKKYFKDQISSVKVGTKLLYLEFALNKVTSDSLLDVLLGIDQIAVDHDIRIMLVFDEFQNIHSYENSRSVEAAFNNAMEKAKGTTYIFSGSKRRLLEKIFADKKTAIFKRCTRLTIGLIQPDEYTAYINKLAKLMWSAEIDDDTLQALYSKTERMPFYVNSLCQKLLLCDEKPTTKDLNRCWEEVYEEELHYIQREYNNFKPNEQKVVSALARKPEKHPLASSFTKNIGLAASSIRQAIRDLEDEDVVGVNDSEQFYIIDPVLKVYARKIVYAEFKMELTL